MKATESVVGTILAGGLAKRMGGGDKCLLPLAGKTLLQRTIDRAKPQVKDLILNANGNALRFARTRLPIVPDLITGQFGPLAGIQASLEWMKSNSSSEWLICFASDTPFFPTNIAQLLLETANKHQKKLVMSETAGRKHPVFSLWHVSMLPTVAAQIETGEAPRLQEWMLEHGALSVEFPVEGFDPFFNLNTPQDIYAAEATAILLDKS